MMNEPLEFQGNLVCPSDYQAKVIVDIFVSVARKFTLNYHGLEYHGEDEESAGEEYTITLEVLEDGDFFPGSDRSEPWLPLRMTMGSADNIDLMERCREVVKAGYIEAIGELVCDQQDGVEGSMNHCTHLMIVHWFKAVAPPPDDPSEEGEVAERIWFYG